MDPYLWFIFAPLIIYYLVMIPFQYRNIRSMKEDNSFQNKHHNEVNEEMSFEEQQAQYNLQGNLINLPATLIASLAYWVVHRK